MRFLAVLLAALLAACAAAPVTTPIPLLLTFSDGTCSGTAIAPHAILTATHCFDGPTVKLSGLTVKLRIDDGNDHTLLIVAQAFRAHAELAPMPKVGAAVSGQSSGDKRCADRRRYTTVPAL